MTGPLALVGGDEWGDGCSFDAELLEASGATEVLVLAAAAAYEHPARAIDRARAWFEGLGVAVRSSSVLQRGDALDQARADEVRAARFVYLADGSSLHLRSVLKDTPVLEALRATWAEGAAVAGSGAAAEVLCDPMVDPRGGAFTVGLGLVPGVTVVAQAEATFAHDHRRTLELADATLAVVGVPARTALVADDGGWRSAGVGQVVVHRAGRPVDISTLAPLAPPS